MTFKDRQKTDRRRPERRAPTSKPVSVERRSKQLRRSATDRRSSPYWRFSWLRLCVSQQLSNC